MMSTALTTELLAALGAHLAAFELPTIASVHLSTHNSGPPITVQLSSHGPSEIAAGLLAWADTLTQITAQAWRVPRGDSLHLSLTGVLPGGEVVQVYGGLWINDLHGATSLQPGATTTVTLATLRHLATPGHTTDEATL